MLQDRIKRTEDWCSWHETKFPIFFKFRLHFCSPTPLWENCPYATERNYTHIQNDLYDMKILSKYKYWRNIYNPLQDQNCNKNITIPNITAEAIFVYIMQTTIVILKLTFPKHDKYFLKIGILMYTNVSSFEDTHQ